MTNETATSGITKWNCVYVQLHFFLNCMERLMTYNGYKHVIFAQINAVNDLLPTSVRLITSLYSIYKALSLFQTNYLLNINTILVENLGTWMTLIFLRIGFHQWIIVAIHVCYSRPSIRLKNVIWYDKWWQCLQQDLIRVCYVYSTLQLSLIIGWAFI